MNVRMINILAIYTRIAQTLMEVTLVLALIVIPGMETFVLVNIVITVVFEKLFCIFLINIFFNWFIFYTDVNECTDVQHTCDLHANCTNTDGSYTCTCIDGYNGDGNICFGKYIFVV